MNKFITVVTGSRAEFGLLQTLLGLIENSPEFELEIVVTGSHFTRTYGNTVLEILEEGFQEFFAMRLNIEKITETGMGPIVGEAVAKFSDYLSERRPDLVVVVGDRYEIFGVAVACAAQGTPIAHIHGGEVTHGSKDDIFRHAISKMSSVHFVANEEFRRRIIQLGENPYYVHVVGGLGVDAIDKVELLSKKQIETSIGIPLKDDLAVVTFHPDTVNPGETGDQVRTIIRAIASLPEIQFLITSANADIHGEEVNSLFKLASNTHPNLFFVGSLGQTRYLSILKLGKVVVGNSSSGLLEAPSLRTATVNIGSRQNGRPRAKSVIDVECVDTKIRDAILTSLSIDFQNSLTHIENPYGKAGASIKIQEILRTIDYESLMPKAFYDVEIGATNAPK